MEDNISVIKKRDGMKYTVRDDRNRYFFPEEWKRFINVVENPKHKVFFLTLLHTGARAMEVLHLKPNNFDFDRSEIEIRIVKHRAAKKRSFSKGKRRNFKISATYSRAMKKYIKSNNIQDNEFIFLDNTKLPSNYNDLNNVEKKKHYNKYKTAYHKLFKRKLIKANIKDYKDFSLHNIRKTYGMWMRTFEIEMADICYRMGHDEQTYMEHYGSSLRFNVSERIDIRKIFGDIK